MNTYLNLIAALLAALFLPGQSDAPQSTPGMPDETPSPVVEPTASAAPTSPIQPSPTPARTPFPRPYSGISLPPLAPLPVAKRDASWPFAIGVKGGLSMAGIRGDGTSDWSNRNGFAGGGFFFLPFSDYFGLQAEVLYVTKGAVHEEDFNGQPLKTTLDLVYLEIPVLARLTIPTSVRVTPTIFAGPALGLKIKGQQEAEYQGQSTSEEIEGLKSTDFGLVLGGGLDVDTGYGKILVDLRYEFGLTNILEEGDIKNGAFLIMGGYSLNFWPF